MCGSDYANIWDSKSVFFQQSGRSNCTLCRTAGREFSLCVGIIIFRFLRTRQEYNRLWFNCNKHSQNLISILFSYKCSEVDCRLSMFSFAGKSEVHTAGRDCSVLVVPWETSEMFYRCIIRVVKCLEDNVVFFLVALLTTNVCPLIQLEILT